jgi:hypothetical protein
MTTLAVSSGLFFLLALCATSRGQSQVKLEYYGVDDIRTSQFGFLRDSLGGNFALVRLNADSLVWKEAVANADQNGISLIIWPVGYGEHWTAWHCNIFSWDISEGLGAMLWAERYVVSGGKALLAVLMSAEPFRNGTKWMPQTTYMLKQLYADLKSVAPHVRLYMDMNNIAYYDSTDPFRRMEDSLVDIVGTHNHCFGTQHTLEETLTEIEADYDAIQRRGLTIPIYFELQSFATDGVEYRMPSATEMIDYAGRILATKKIAGAFWYPWDRAASSYTAWLSKDRYDSTGADRWAVVRRMSPVVTAVRSGDEEFPGAYALYQNYPNPFNPITVIKYTVGATGSRGPGDCLKLTVYDMLGRKVEELVNERRLPGSYEVSFDGSHLATGVYVYQLWSGSFIQSGKMFLIK